MEAEANNRGNSSSHQKTQSSNTSRKGLLTSEGKEIKNRDKNLPAVTVAYYHTHIRVKVK